jgi:hypothetical protein
VVNKLKDMKTITTILFLLTTMFVNSQSLNHLDYVSASNLYVSTNKKQVLTKYETTPEPMFILFYGDGEVSNLKNYDYIVFNTKSDLLGFLNITERSILKNKTITHIMEKNKVKMEGVTSQTAELNVNKYYFYLNVASINDIKKQLND